MNLSNLCCLSLHNYLHLSTPFWQGHAGPIGIKMVQHLCKSKHPRPGSEGSETTSARNLMMCMRCFTQRGVVSALLYTQVFGWILSLIHKHKNVSVLGIKPAFPSHARSCHPAQTHINDWRGQVLWFKWKERAKECSPPLMAGEEMWMRSTYALADCSVEVEEQADEHWWQHICVFVVELNKQLCICIRLPPTMQSPFRPSSSFWGIPVISACPNLARKLIRPAPTAQPQQPSQKE